MKLTASLQGLAAFNQGENTMAPRIDKKLRQYDGYVSRIGQLEAKRYLAAREQPPRFSRHTSGGFRVRAYLTALVGGYLSTLVVYTYTIHVY